VRAWSAGASGPTEAASRWRCLAEAGRWESMARRRTVTIDSSPEAVFRHLDAEAIVCIDVMLSATTLATAVAQGRRVFVAPTGPLAHSRAGELADPCLMASGEGAPHRAFGLDDSPTALLHQPLSCPLVLHSPPGTDLIVNSARCRRVLVACFRNLTATARELQRFGDVALVGAGCREEFSCEDQMAAAWIGARLLGEGFTPGDRRTAALIERWGGIEPALAGWGNSAEALRLAGAGDELAFVLSHLDDLEVACLARPDGTVEPVRPPRPSQAGAWPPPGLEVGEPVSALGGPLR
jgi:phosphosulfolactate phosphohydrolase-like enzyme